MNLNLTTGYPYLLEGTSMAALPFYSRHTPDAQSTTDSFTM